jgi:hypothetical protein
MWELQLQTTLNFSNRERGDGLVPCPGHITSRKSSPVSNGCSVGPKASMDGVRKREISEINGTQTLIV